MKATFAERWHRRLRIGPEATIVLSVGAMVMCTAAILGGAATTLAWTLLAANTLGAIGTAINLMRDR